MPLLFLLLVSVPIIEIALFIEIGGAIGTWPTIGAIILTAAAGAVLLRMQGSGLIARARATLNRGEMPVEEVIHGLFLLVAGALLLTPGFFTDAIGLLLCIPPLRLALGRTILKRARGRMQAHVSGFRQGPQGPSSGGSGHDPDEPDSGKPESGVPPGIPGKGSSRWRQPPEHPEDRNGRS